MPPVLFADNYLAGSLLTLLLPIALLIVIAIWYVIAAKKVPEASRTVAGATPPAATAATPPPATAATPPPATAAPDSQPAAGSGPPAEAPPGDS
jgi:hypothetical protein